MASTSNTTLQSSNFQAVFESALASYERMTEHNPITHPLFSRIDQCESPDSVLSVFQEQTQELEGFGIDDPKLMTWLKPIVRGLYTLLATADPGSRTVNLSGLSTFFL